MLLPIIVVYNKEIKELPILNSPFQLKTEIFIYDNSLFPQEVPIIENLTIYYTHDKNNSGVSRAYNQGVMIAKKIDKRAVVLLDQDTFFTKDFLTLYEEKYIEYGEQYIYSPIICNSNSTKIYSPSLLNNFIGKTQSFDEFQFREKYDLNKKSVINSGLMIPISLFEKIGGYKENIKLDFSDIYFIEKYKQIENKIILIDLYINHCISGDEGYNFSKEYTRYKYYCLGAKELQNALNISIWYSPFRRLLRLTLKYKSFVFFKIFFTYFYK